MIRYHIPVRPQKHGWIYACADDSIGHSERHWKQLTRPEVKFLLATGWKFYHKHDEYLYDIDPTPHTQEGCMKIIEETGVAINTNMLAMGDTFRHDGKYYIQTNRNGYAVNLATGLETQFASVLVERVNMECHVLRAG